MAWVRFKEPLERRTLARLRELLSAAPKARTRFTAGFRNEAPFACCLAHDVDPYESKENN